VRLLTGALAALVAAAAGLWLRHLATGPDHYLTAYVLTASICAGGVAYAIGSVRGARRLMWGGWLAMLAPLLVPSTFTLFLPVVALIGLGLREVVR
jgi:hypothetical protein